MTSENLGKRPPRLQFRLQLLFVIVFLVAAGLGAMLAARKWVESRRPVPLAVKVAPVDAIPPDGVPRRFVVSSSYAAGPIFIVRDAKRIQAFNARCPDCGGELAFDTKKKVFVCPVRSDTFDGNGQLVGVRNASPRPMDELTCQILNHNSREYLYVTFCHFVRSTYEKIPTRYY